MYEKLDKVYNLICPRTSKLLKIYTPVKVTFITHLYELKADVMSLKLIRFGVLKQTAQIYIQLSSLQPDSRTWDTGMCMSGCVEPYSIQLVPSTGVCMTLTRKASSIYLRVVFSLFVAYCIYLSR